MFKRFKKEQQEEPIEVKTPCELFGHNWRDFPAYIEYEYHNNWFEIKIIEPYVCTICHTRDNIVLLKQEEYGSRKVFDRVLKEIEEENKTIIKPRAVVNDMVNDAIRVDRLKLECWDKLHIPERG